MSVGCSSLLSVCVLFLVIVTFLLQLVTLTTTWWTTFTARTDLGKPVENGHYGLWTICSTKGPQWTEDCDPLDTFFQIPPYSQVSGILGVVHLLLLLSFLPLGSIRAIQVIRNVPRLGIKPKLLCIAKVSVAFISAIVAILVAIFSSIDENRPLEYSIQKGWSFWIQISVIGLDILITLVCVTENVLFWQQHMQQQVDLEGKQEATYRNPSFDSGSPTPARRLPSMGTISYTESSGLPYHNGDERQHRKESSGHNVFQPDRRRIVDETSSHPKPSKGNKRRQTETLTYENESYQEHSPRRSRQNERAYYQR